MNSEADFFSHSYRAWRGKKRSSSKIPLVPSAPSFQRLELLLKAVMREIRGLNRPPDQRPYSIDQSLMIGTLSLAKSLSDLFKEINEDVWEVPTSYLAIGRFFPVAKLLGHTPGPFGRAHGPDYIKWASRVRSGEWDASKGNIVLLISFFVDKTNNHAF